MIADCLFVSLLTHLLGFGRDLVLIKFRSLSFENGRGIEDKVRE